MNNLSVLFTAQNVSCELYGFSVGSSAQQIAHCNGFSGYACYSAVFYEVTALLCRALTLSFAVQPLTAVAGLVLRERWQFLGISLGVPIVLWIALKLFLRRRWDFGGERAGTASAVQSVMAVGSLS